jgi:uncharacterized protein
MTALADIPPQPLPNVETTAFWEATAAGHVALCRCTDCLTYLHPPLERCRVCGGETAFEELPSVTGTVTGRIVMHRSSVPGQGPGPYAIVLVDMDAAPGVRLTGRIAGLDPADVRVGQRVAARIVPVPGSNYHQPEFVPL